MVLDVKRIADNTGCSTIHSLEASRALANNGPLRCAECDASSRHFSTTTTCFGVVIRRYHIVLLAVILSLRRLSLRFQQFDELSAIFGLHLEPTTIIKLPSALV